MHEETEELLFEFDLRKPPRIANTLQVEHSMGVRDASAGFLIIVVRKQAPHQGHQDGVVLSRLWFEETVIDAAAD